MLNNKTIIFLGDVRDKDRVMLTAQESYEAVKRDNYYIICPSEGNWDRDKYCKVTGAKTVKDGFEYDSGSNDEWLSVVDIEKLIHDEEMM